MPNKRHRWTKNEIDTILDMYNSGLSVQEISQKLNITTGAIYSVFKHQNIKLDIRSPKDCRFSADYHSYDWCYQRYIMEGKSFEEMAEEANCKPRTIQKWCSEIYKLNRRTASNIIKLNQKQIELIMFSLLGDGHIAKRDCCFIVSHSEAQKDYLMWKYEILKNLCLSPPILQEESIAVFNGKTYHKSKQYRLRTRKIDDLRKIQLKSKSDIISELNEFGLSIHFLDDGSCSGGYWSLCYAALSLEDRNLYCNILKDKFNISPHLRNDDRYIGFNKNDSAKISEIILRNIPNNLDIIKNKILRIDKYA